MCSTHCLTSSSFHPRREGGQGALVLHAIARCPHCPGLVLEPSGCHLPGLLAFSEHAASRSIFLKPAQVLAGFEVRAHPQQMKHLSVSGAQNRRGLLSGFRQMSRTQEKRFMSQTGGHSQSSCVRSKDGGFIGNSGGLCGLDEKAPFSPRR